MNALRDSNAVHGLDREINEFLEDFVGFREKSANVLGTLFFFPILCIQNSMNPIRDSIFFGKSSLNSLRYSNVFNGLD